MTLDELPINKPTHSQKQNITLGQFFAVQNADGAALIFQCTGSNDLEVFSNTERFGQYECYLILLSSLALIKELQEKCQNDYVAWTQRCGVGNSGKIDLSVLATKFKVR